MKVPYSWLKEYIDTTLTPEELAKELLRSGFEVEGIENTGREIENVRICRITNITRHPNADRIQVCDIDLGDRETVVLTAATNVFPGAVVPVALDGAFLPEGKRIFAGPIRGVVSNGMFCSGEELRIDNSVIAGAEVDGILILPDDAPVGADIRDYLGMNESVFDISVTSNRPDCQSIIGLAREVSAILNTPLKDINLKHKQGAGDAKKILSIEVPASDLCPNYYGAVVKNVVIKESPKWMRDRLRMVGIRPINTIVDITNYVLTEVGQPMHAFDLRDISGGKIVVRRAAKDEKITTLDDKEFRLNESNLVIADASRAIGVAGVMGGKNSEIKPDTKNIAFESARFVRGNIRATARALGQRTAASARFERGIDAWTTATGLARALALIDELSVGEVVGTPIIVETEPPKACEITVKLSRIHGLLGIVVPTEVLESILQSLGIKTAVSGDELRCTVPAFREDLENFADIAEEIIRIYGYDHIVPTLPKLESIAQKQQMIVRTDRLKDVLVGLGACETATYSFIHPAAFDKLNLDKTDARRDCVVLKNPISEDFSVMRTTMAHNVLSVAALNLNRKNFDFRLFEIARVYLPKRLPLTESPTEEERLTVTVAGARESFFTLKGILDEVAAVFGTKFGYGNVRDNFLHPGQSAAVLMRGKPIGYMGQVHPTVAKNYEIEKPVWWAEINFGAILETEQKTVKFVALPRFQEIERDLAYKVADETKAGDMLGTIKREGGTKLESVTVFDVYTGKQIEAGFKSIAFKLTFRSPSATLTDAEIEPLIAKINAAMKKKFGAELRS